MYKAPYDTRNQLDYEAVTKKIAHALEILENDTSIPATEIKLAELADCSRGTLRNRVYPLVRLRKIKQSRFKKQNKPKLSSLTAQQLTDVNIHISDKRILKEQLEKSRSEIAVWVTKFLELEKDVKRLERLVTVLQGAKEILETKLSQPKNAVEGDSNSKSI